MIRNTAWKYWLPLAPCKSAACEARSGVRVKTEWPSAGWKAAAGICSSHTIAGRERQLKGLLADYVRYDHDDRTHLGLRKQTPGGRVRSAGRGCIVSHPRLGGLHHRYERAA